MRVNCVTKAAPVGTRPSIFTHPSPSVCLAIKKTARRTTTCRLRVWRGWRWRNGRWPTARHRCRPALRRLPALIATPTRPTGSTLPLTTPVLSIACSATFPPTPRPITTRGNVPTVITPPTGAPHLLTTTGWPPAVIVTNCRRNIIRVRARCATPPVPGSRFGLTTPALMTV